MSTVSPAFAPSHEPYSGSWKVPLGVIAAALLLGHAPLAVFHFRELWQKEQYQYFPFVIGVVAWLGWQRWQVAEPVRRSSRFRSVLSQIAVLASILLLVTSLLTISGWLAYVSMVVGMAGVLGWAGTKRDVRALWPVWCLLWLMAPPPLGVDDRLVVFLQQLSSYLSSTILDMLGVQHVMAGNVLAMPDKEFFVDEACSGIVSVMSIVACAAIYGVWRRRTILHTLLLATCGMLWAVVTNIARICIIAAAHQWWDIDLSEGTPHEMLGLVLFCVTFLALYGTDHLLIFLLAPIDLEKVGAGASENRLVAWWNRLIAPGRPRAHQQDAEAEPEPVVAAKPVRMPGIKMAAIVAVPLVILGAVQLAWWPSVDTQAARDATERALALSADDLPEQVGPWRRESFDTVEREAFSDFGRYSRSYIYRHASDPNLAVNVSLDFPYIGGWHDLCVCYRNSGWDVNQREAIEGGGEADWAYVEGDLEDPTGERAMVMFAGFSVNGDLAEPPSQLVLRRSWFRMRRRLLEHISPQLMQVQVFAVGDFKQNAKTKEDIKQLFDVVRRELHQRVAASDDLPTDS